MPLAQNSQVYWLNEALQHDKTKLKSSLRRHLVSVAATLVVLALANGRSTAQDAGQCLSCHQEKGLTMSRKGREVPLHVDRAAFKASAHGELECVACHIGFNPSNLPHARRIRPVDCTSCHGDEQVAMYGHSVHAVKKSGAPAAACADCHTAHAVKTISGQSPEARKQFALETCAKCHADAKAQFVASDHGVALSGGSAGAP